LAYRDPTYEAGRGHIFYEASKTLSKQAFWTFMRENDLGFLLNAVLVSLSFCASLDPAHQEHASTSGIIFFSPGITGPLVSLPYRKSAHAPYFT